MGTGAEGSPAGIFSLGELAGICIGPREIEVAGVIIEEHVGTVAVESTG